MAGLHETKTSFPKSLGFAPITLTNADTAQVSAIVDMQGLESVEWVIALGTLTDANATYAVVVSHGDAVDDVDAPTTITDTASAPDECLVGTEAAAGGTYADDLTVKSICYTPGYGAGKRYARLTLTPSGNDSGAFPVACIAIKKPYSVGA